MAALFLIMQSPLISVPLPHHFTFGLTATRATIASPLCLQRGDLDRERERGTERDRGARVKNMGMEYDAERDAHIRKTVGFSL